MGLCCRMLGMSPGICRCLGLRETTPSRHRAHRRLHFLFVNAPPDIHYLPQTWFTPIQATFSLNPPMNVQVNFKSAAFPKYPNEDAEIVNAHCWGKRLAEFLRDGLPRFGVQTADILSEDWGWLVNTKNEGFPLWLGCGPVADVDEGEVQPEEAARGGVSTEFVVFVTAEPGFFQRLFSRVDTKPAVQGTAAALKSLLESSPEISEISWTAGA